MLPIIAIIVAALVITPFLMSLILPKEFVLISVIKIDKPLEEVFAYVIQLKNQEEYSKWIMADRKIKLSYKGTDGKAGFIVSWKSGHKNIGEGEQEITRILDGEGYDTEIRFGQPFKGVSHAQTRLKALSEQQTEVTTTIITRTPFPMNFMSSLMKNVILKNMDQTSANLKKTLEKQKDTV